MENDKNVLDFWIRNSKVLFQISGLLTSSTLKSKEFLVQNCNHKCLCPYICTSIFKVFLRQHLNFWQMRTGTLLNRKFAQNGCTTTLQSTRYMTCEVGQAQKVQLRTWVGLIYVRICYSRCFYVGTYTLRIYNV